MFINLFYSSYCSFIIGVACVAKLQEGTYVRAVYIRGVIYPSKHCQVKLILSFPSSISVTHLLALEFVSFQQ